MTKSAPVAQWMSTATGQGYTPPVGERRHVGSTPTGRHHAQRRVLASPAGNGGLECAARPSKAWAPPEPVRKPAPGIPNQAGKSKILSE